ncbi:MAG: hypothetical protein IIU63_07735, partial [Clostridia bacterium]|nr:hypothetical protein [Clostridia bacterium]
RPKYIPLRKPFGEIIKNRFVGRPMVAPTVAYREEHKKPERQMKSACGGWKMLYNRCFAAPRFGVYGY